MEYQLNKIEQNFTTILNTLNLRYLTQKDKRIIKTNIGRALIYLSVINNINKFYTKEQIEQLYLFKKKDILRKNKLKEKVEFIIDDLVSYNYKMTQYDTLNIFDTLIEVSQYYDLNIKDCYNDALCIKNYEDYELKKGQF